MASFVILLLRQCQQYSFLLHLQGAKVKRAFRNNLDWIPSKEMKFRTQLDKLLHMQNTGL